MLIALHFARQGMSAETQKESMRLQMEMRNALRTIDAHLLDSHAVLSFACAFHAREGDLHVFHNCKRVAGTIFDFLSSKDERSGDAPYSVPKQETRLTGTTLEFLSKCSITPKELFRLFSRGLVQFAL